MTVQQFQQEVVHPRAAHEKEEAEAGGEHEPQFLPRLLPAGQVRQLGGVADIPGAQDLLQQLRARRRQQHPGRIVGRVICHEVLRGKEPLVRFLRAQQVLQGTRPQDFEEPIVDAPELGRVRRLYFGLAGGVEGQLRGDVHRRAAQLAGEEAADGMEFLA